MKWPTVWIALLASLFSAAITDWRRSKEIARENIQIVALQKELDRAVVLNADCVSQAKQDQTIVQEAITRLIVCEGTHR